MSSATFLQNRKASFSGIGRLVRAPRAQCVVDSVTVAGQTVVQKDVDQKIAADQYLAAKYAAAKSPFGLRLSKIIPPGAG